jgi:Bacterial membrane protein YfhO
MSALASPSRASAAPRHRAIPAPGGARAREALVVGLLFAALVCLFYYEVVFLNRTFLPFGYPAEILGPAPPWGFAGTVRKEIADFRLDSGGSAWQLEPWARAVAASYAAGTLPLWNPHQFFGTPLAGDAQPGAFDLFRLPAVLTTHGWAWDVYYLAQSALGLTLTYAFARSVGFRPQASFLVSVAYTFCGFFFIRGNMHYVEIYHLLPGILWGTERVVRGHARSGIALVAGGIALTLFAGFPEATLMTFLYAASYGAFRVGWAAVERRSWGLAARRLAALAVAWLGGVGLAAPLVVPLFEYLGLSFNIHPPERQLGLVSLPLRALGFIGVPYIAGLPSKPIVAAAGYTVDDYSGAAVLLLAIIGIASLGRLGPLRPVVVFALLSVIIWGAKLYGVPGVERVGGLPLLAQTLIYIFASPLLSLSLALLGGAGVQAIMSGGPSRRVATIALVVLGLYLGLAAALNWQPLTADGASHVAATLGLATGAGLLAWLVAVTARARGGLVAASACCLVVVGELFLLSPRGVYSDRYDTLVKPPFVAWLQQQAAAGQPFRVFSNDGLLYPDYASAFGLDDVRDVDALYPRRTWDFVHTFLSPSTSDRYVGGFGHPELPTELFGNTWLDLSNVRFVLRPAGHGPADASLAELIVARHYPPPAAFDVAEFTLDGQRREVLLQRAPEEVRFHATPEADRPTLTFFVGLDPRAPQGRVRFVASVEAGGQRRAAFQRTVDPVQTEADRHWIAGTIDLTPDVGRDVDVVFQAEPLDGPAGVRPGWGDLHLVPLVDPDRFRLVYDHEVSIWENTRALPRAYLVGSVLGVATQAEAIAALRDPGFDPARMAVVEGASAPDLPSASTDPGAVGTVTITDYGQQAVAMTVDAARPALLVLTDSFYPGWHATVDGADVPIMPTDVAFRGVLIAPGQHRVLYTYRPASFALGVAVAALAVVVLGLALWLAARRAA